MGTIDYDLPVDRIRLAIADYLDPEVLSDDTIQKVLDRHSGNETAAIRECAMYILGSLRQGRVRLDRLEIHGAESFNSYLKYLEKVINNPNSPLGGITAGIYAAGIDVEDIVANATDTSIFYKPLPVNNSDTEYSSLVSTELKYE